MPEITFRPSETKINAQTGDNLAALIKNAGIELFLPCGGEGKCGKCIVKIESGKVDSDSFGKLSPSETNEGYVCACHTKILNTDLIVFIPDQLKHGSGEFSDVFEDIELIQKDLFPGPDEIKPLAGKLLITIPPPEPMNGLSDTDRITRQIQLTRGNYEVIYPLPIIRTASDIIREENGVVTLTTIHHSDRIYVSGLEPGDTTSSLYGIAIDVGTTTVAVQLVDQVNNKIVGTCAGYNAQINCGLDIISRINYASSQERLEELRQLILDTINKLIDQIGTTSGVLKCDISNAVLSGNTTMIHLLLGLNPDYIRLEPYTPTLLNIPYQTAKDVGISIHPDSWLYFSPCVGSYVGGDITAGLLCSNLATSTEEISLFIDIGTNGEIVLGNNEFLVACSCSAGPAFEGGGIKNGMWASKGAINKVEIESETGIATYSVIGDTKPIGICGTGIISLLANLLLTGWMDPAGKLNRDKECSSIAINGKKAFFILVPAKHSGTQKDIIISETEIENVIRAKAAVYSACRLIMEQLEISYKDVSTIYIAGGFGKFLDIDNARIIGLIPDEPPEKFRYVGNSSLIGSNMILVSEKFRQKQVDLARRMTYIDLSTDAKYMDQYTGALFMPHTDKSLFPHVSRLLQKTK